MMPSLLHAIDSCGFDYTLDSKAVIPECDCGRGMKTTTHTALDEVLAELDQFKAQSGRYPKYHGVKVSTYNDLADEILFFAGHRDKGTWVELRLGDGFVEVFPDSGVGRL